MKQHQQTMLDLSEIINQGRRMLYSARSHKGKNKTDVQIPVVVCAIALLASIVCSKVLASDTRTDNSGHCPAFTESDLYREPVKTTLADPSNWIRLIQDAVDGEEILLADGVYRIEQYPAVSKTSITIRSASGNNEAVVIEGAGYSVNAEALMVMANNVHIADVTIKNVRDHGITIQEGFESPVIYNVNLVDIGTQHIKGNRPGPKGTIACSRIGYSESGAKGDYNSAIDLHSAVAWTIRDNYIYNIYGDGSGCIVDIDCGSMWPGGEPAILLWQGSKDNIVERNTIVDSFRGIALGLNTPYSGGRVQDNFICRSELGKEGVNGFIDGDAGVSLARASGVRIANNRIILPGDYPGQIEVQEGSGIVIENNVMSKPVWNRGSAEYIEAGNIYDADISNVSCYEPETLTVTSLESKPPVAVATNTLNEQSLLSTSNITDILKSIEESIGVLATQVDVSHEVKILLLEVRLERIKAKEERLMATSERLRAKEERLMMMQENFRIKERLIRLEHAYKTLHRRGKTSQ